MRVRQGARVVLLTADRQFLLFHFAYDEGPLAGTDYWGLPGGGVEEGESPEQAAVRELREETGIVAERVGPLVMESSYDFRLSTGEDVRQHDYYFVLRVDTPSALSRAGLTPEETASLVEERWWTLEELRLTGEHIVPGDMAAVLSRLTGIETA